MSAVFEPPYVAAHEVVPTLKRQGYVLLDPPQMALALGLEPVEGQSLAQGEGQGEGLLALQSWGAYWDDLPPDAYLRDGGRYRRRRHSCFEVSGGTVLLCPRRAHWQPLDYNALHGGLERWFEPMPQSWVGTRGWLDLLYGLGRLCDQVLAEPNRPVMPRRWSVESHVFRIDTTDGIGRPTPEGAHRDGVDFVAVFLVQRQAVKGGETRVFEAQGPSGVRFTLEQPWSLLLLDDARVIHETTPIQPRGAAGHRDTLVLTLRQGGFQGPTA
jgi:hypothetical protein